MALRRAWRADRGHSGSCMLTLGSFLSDAEDPDRRALRTPEQETGMCKAAQHQGSVVVLTLGENLPSQNDRLFILRYFFY